MTYDTETWPLTLNLVRKFNVRQRAKKMAMMAVFLQDIMRFAAELKSPTNLKDRETQVAVGGANHLQNDG